MYWVSNTTWVGLTLFWVFHCLPDLPRPMGIWQKQDGWTPKSKSTQTRVAIKFGNKIVTKKPPREKSLKVYNSRNQYVVCTCLLCRLDFHDYFCEDFHHDFFQLNCHPGPRADGTPCGRLDHLREQVGICWHCCPDGKGGHEGCQKVRPVRGGQSEDPPEADIDWLIFLFQWNASLLKKHDSNPFLSNPED